MDGTTQIIARTIRTKKAIGHRGEINSKSCVTQEMTVLHFPTEAFFFFSQKWRQMRPKVTVYCVWSLHVHISFLKSTVSELVVSSFHIFQNRQRSTQMKFWNF